MTTSHTKPYLLRAIHEWCVESGFTPYVVVRVDENTRVPMAYVRDGQIVLNIAPYATHQLSISNDDISCQARFNGVAQQLYVPVSNVVAIYARETGQGLAFQPGVDSGSAMEIGGVLEATDDSETDTEHAGEQFADPADQSGGSSGDQSPQSNGGTRPSHLRIIK